MSHSRRKFFQFAGAAAAGAFLLQNWSCTSETANTEAGAETAAAPPTAVGSIPNYGIQLWSVRDDMAKDPKGVLKQLASYGYKQIESFEGDKGIYWGMSNTEFKAYMDELGMNLIASHCDIKKDFEKKAAEAAAIGMKYLICPWMGPQKTMADWKKIADDFNRLGGICKQNGIGFAYHNHAYSFETLENQVPQDFLLENTDPALVSFEMDMYWVVTGQKDPAAYLQKYPNRFRLCHVKDRDKTVAPAEEEASCDLGTGSIDYPKLLKTAKDNGMEYFIVEQERWVNSTPMKSAEVDAAYMGKLVFA